MKIATWIVRAAGLGLTIVPACLHYGAGLGAGAMRHLMLAGAVLWFGAVLWGEGVRRR
ncbi:MAG TPA: hypothetical protein P5555_05180 [Candidatus Paceibacterota bacterium]|nr:hypothetical protein [Verrucomicrobiota bacterium]HRZ44565.1 hypothetical protein [Candidatus Paceibacterota bacterium]HRZ93398.1 hypothetical protein [Candidatus Paceibacterota bacterium]